MGGFSFSELAVARLSQEGTKWYAVNGSRKKKQKLENGEKLQIKQNLNCETLRSPNSGISQQQAKKRIAAKTAKWGVARGSSISWVAKSKGGDN